MMITMQAHTHHALLFFSLSTILQIVRNSVVHKLIRHQPQTKRIDNEEKEKNPTDKPNMRFVDKQ